MFVKPQVALVALVLPVHHLVLRVAPVALLRVVARQVHRQVLRVAQALQVPRLVAQVAQVAPKVRTNTVRLQML